MLTRERQLPSLAEPGSPKTRSAQAQSLKCLMKVDVNHLDVEKAKIALKKWLVLASCVAGYNICVALVYHRGQLILFVKCGGVQLCVLCLSPCFVIFLYLTTWFSFPRQIVPSFKIPNYERYARIQQSIHTTTNSRCLIPPTYSSYSIMDSIQKQLD